MRAQAHLLTGESELKLKRWEPAHQAFRSAVGAAGGDADVKFRALAGSGLAMEELKQWAQAARYYDEVASGSADKELEFFAGLTADQWKTPVYSEDALWDARSLLAHFVSAEQSLLKLYQRIAAGGPGVAEDFDLNRYNQSRVAKMADQSPAELIEDFRIARAAMIEWVKGLTDADLEKRGRHAAYGVDRLEVFLEEVCTHNLYHETDLRAALEEE